MDARRLIRALTLFSLLAFARTSAATSWTVVDPGQGAVALAGGDAKARELSGLAWAGGNRYLAVSDKDPKLYSVTIDLKPDGSIAAAKVTGVVSLTKAVDAEGVAVTAGGRVFVSDEAGPAVREYDAATGAVIRELSVPPVFQQVRRNQALESLTLNNDPLLIWTANEEALTPDGDPSSTAHGSVVRLQRFDRDLQPNGQWALVTEPLPAGSNTPRAELESAALTDLVALPDGDLFALERASGGKPPKLWARLFQLELSTATDVSTLPSLRDAKYSPARKTALWQHSDSKHNFEGAALGPAVGDGRSLILISDDGGLLQQSLYALVIKPAVCGNGVVETPETCDDKNMEPGDGCSPSCRLEGCGDGMVNNRGTERCDDGNTADGDGCSSTCQLEGDVRICQDTILKAARGYAQDRLKALRDCRRKLNRGRELFADRDKSIAITNPQDCIHADEVTRRLSKASVQLRDAIAGGRPARCSDAVVKRLTACADTVDGLVSSDGKSGCLITSHDQAIDRMIRASSGRLLGPQEGDARRCQEAILRATDTYLQARWQALETCESQWLQGRSLYGDPEQSRALAGPRDCADEYRAARRIARAANKVRLTIATPGRAACSDADLAALGSLCATTVDGLADATGTGGCLLSEYDAAVDALMRAER